jgi:hypothetical protein
MEIIRFMAFHFLAWTLTMLRGPSLKGFGNCLKIRGAESKTTAKLGRGISG